MTLLAVDRAELFAIGGPLPVAAGNARAIWSSRHGVALRLEAAGLVGWGECAPLPGVSLETLDDAAAALGVLLAAELPVLDLEAPFRAIAAWGERLPPTAPSARFALDTALFDLCAAACGCPVAALIGGHTAPLPASMMIDLPFWRDEVPVALERGITTFKIKIGRPDQLDAELAALAELRAAHPAVGLRLDANGALRPGEIVGALEALAAFAPEWIEQPLPPGWLASLPPPPCPIAADESVVADDDDLWRAIHLGVVTIAVVKPALLGGLLRAAELSERANGVGLEVVVSHLLDGPIALAAAAELAVALGGTRAAGLGPHPGLAAFPPIAVPQLEGGTLCTSGPGLGVSLE